MVRLVGSVVEYTKQYTEPEILLLLVGVEKGNYCVVVFLFIKKTNYYFF